MATSRLQVQPDSLPELPKKRTFSLPSFRRGASGGQRQEVAISAEEMARSAEAVVRAQKAAAWQWYTRGVGEDAKRPPLANFRSSQAPTEDKSDIDSGSERGESITNCRHALQKKPSEPLRAEESLRAASRFKAEAGLTRTTSSGAPPPLPPSSDPPPPTPLYDEFELSGLRTQMTNFVQRLQDQQTKDNEQPPAVSDPKNSQSPDFPTDSSVSNDHQQTKAPPVAAAPVTVHQLPKLPTSAAPVASAVPFHMKPFSALRRLLCKVLPGSTTKSTKNPLKSSPVVYEPELLSEDDSTQHHHHHYIHHHHHHYHYDQSSDESAVTFHSRRRQSDNSGIRPQLSALWEAAYEDDEEEVEASPMNAYLARRRRHSDSFTFQSSSKKAASDEGQGMEGETGKVGSAQFLKLYKSERLPPNKIPIVVSAGLVQPAAAAGSLEELDEELVEMTGSRRHSADMHRRQVASLERKVEEAGCGKSGGGKYKLSGAAGGGGTQQGRRRHSESSGRLKVVQSEMGRRTPSPGRSCLLSPSARCSGVPASANATHARTRSTAFPPLYPKEY